jgi:hypothetical protein
MERTEVGPGEGVEAPMDLEPCSERMRASNSTISSPWTLRFHSRWAHNSRSIWLISWRANIFCATMTQDWFEYVSSHKTFDAIMSAEMKSRWPDEPLAAGYRVFNRCSSNRAAKVTIEERRVRYRAYATKRASSGVGLPRCVAVGMLGHWKSEVI